MEPGGADVQARLTYQPHTDRQQYNIPTGNEIAIILPRENITADHRDIILQLKGGSLKRIHEGNHAYIPLHYVLLFPRGKLDWHKDILLRGLPEPLNCPPEPEKDGDSLDEDGKKLTMAKYHHYQLFTHDAEAQTLFKSGKLFQQYPVGAWAMTEQYRLKWFQHHQSDLQAELYNQMTNTFAGLDNDLNPADGGMKVILPASFTGGTRDMMENLQNLLAITRKYGPPDAFIAMTVNPKWPEVMDALLPGKTPQDRPGLVTWVFHLKVEQLIKGITKDGILGQTVAKVLEFGLQKCGLQKATCHLMWTCSIKTTK